MKNNLYSKKDLRKLGLTEHDVNVILYELKIPYLVNGLLLEVHEHIDDVKNIHYKKIVKLNNKVVVVDHYLWEAILRDQNNLFLYRDKDNNIYYFKGNVNQPNHVNKQYSISKIIGFKPFPREIKELKDKDIKDSLLSAEEINELFKIQTIEDVKKCKNIIEKLETSDNEEKKKINEDFSTRELKRKRSITEKDLKTISIMLKSPRINNDSVVGIVYDKDKPEKNNNHIRHGLNKILISDGKVIHYYKKENMVDEILNR